MFYCIDVADVILLACFAWRFHLEVTRHVAVTWENDSK